MGQDFSLDGTCKSRLSLAFNPHVTNHNLNSLPISHSSSSSNDLFQLKSTCQPPNLAYTSRIPSPWLHQHCLSKCSLTLSNRLQRLCLRKQSPGTSLAVQWLRCRASNAEGVGSSPGQGIKPHMPHRQKKQKKERKKENKVHVCNH